MSSSSSSQLGLRLLNQASLILFAVVLLVFGVLSPAFFQPANAVNILIQTSSTGILAVGMTFVLLTAGVDLSVGAIMFVAAAVGGKLILGGWSLSGVLVVMLAIGVVYGALNALFITRLAIMAFIVTLATRYFGRGLGLRITETRAMNLPDSFYELGAARILGVPLPILIFAGVTLVAHLVLTRTPLGRQIYAVGADVEAARKAGINTRGVLFVVYVVCGLCAAARSCRQ
ncbi:MAG: ABC transporter permease [Verrucomicrobiota bacterium]